MAVTYLGDCTSFFPEGNQIARARTLPADVGVGTLVILHWRCEKSYIHAYKPRIVLKAAAGQYTGVTGQRLDVEEPQVSIGLGQIHYKYQVDQWIAGQPHILGFVAVKLADLDPPILVTTTIPNYTINPEFCLTFWNGVEQIFWDGAAAEPGQAEHPFEVESHQPPFDAPHSVHWIHQWNQPIHHELGFAMDDKLSGPDGAVRHEVIVQNGGDGTSPGAPGLIAKCLDEPPGSVDVLTPHGVIAIGLSDVEPEEDENPGGGGAVVIGGSARQYDQHINYPRWAYTGELHQLDENYKTLERFCRTGSESKCSLKVRHHPTAREQVENWYRIERWARMYVSTGGCLCTDQSTTRVPSDQKCFLRVPHKEWAVTTRDPREEQENWLAVDRWMTTLANDSDCDCEGPPPPE